MHTAKARALYNHETLTFNLAQVGKRQPATSHNIILSETIRNAIYVGDLPYNIGETTLLLVFSHYGLVLGVEVKVGPAFRDLLFVTDRSAEGIAYAYIYLDPAIVEYPIAVVHAQSPHKADVKANMTSAT